MTSHAPAEVAQNRGKTLTPESPVPVHVPEPQNIPVLMNQTDLIFNDMSTHMEHRYPAQNQDAAITNGLQEQLADTFTTPITSSEYAPAQPLVQGTGGFENEFDSENGLRNTLVDENKFTEQQQNHHTSEHLLNDRSSVPHGDGDSLSNPAKTPTPTPLNPDRNQVAPANTQQSVGPFSDETPSPPASPGPDAAVPPAQAESDARSHASGSDVDGEGVNYQALLDNLSPSTSAAPVPDSITSTTSVAPPTSSSPGSAQTPIATFPIPPGLPARPPPQEKPAIHPNYTPGEDIRSYHNPPAQNSSAAATFNAQSNNTPRPPQGYNPNSGVAPNGLPPPPIATFQQPLSKANQPQASPLTAQGRTSDNQQGNSANGPASAEGEDEVPRRPEVERVYEEFLREEAIYVAEGTWDRFPQGSRLFVGMYSFPQLMLLMRY